MSGIQDVGVEHALRGDLGAGVTRTDYHEGGAGDAFGGIVGEVGELHLPSHVVAQVSALLTGSFSRALGPTRPLRVLVASEGRRGAGQDGVQRSRDLVVTVVDGMLITH